MLELKQVGAAYDQVQVLFDVSMNVKPGEIHCLLGRNGAGKTTTLKTIMGLVTANKGTLSFNNVSLNGLSAHQIPKQKIAYVPQGRGLFTELSVAQNIEVGLMVRGKGTSTKDKVLELFPRLKERLKQRAETLSGGEQQMLAMARALCIEPDLILLDEPTEGLQPSMIQLIRDVTIKMRDEGAAILLVEQRIDAVLSIADRVSFIERGVIAETVTASSVQNNPAMLTRYLGV